MTTPQRQERNQQAVEEMAPDRSQSDDAKMSVSETRRLQAEAQARIDKTRNPNDIGVAP
jgi:hypothetical protein